MEDPVASSAIERANDYKVLGNKAFVAGRYGEAAKAYTFAMQLNPEERSYYGNRSAAWSKLGQFSKALADADAALALDCSNAKGLLRRAVAYMGLKNFAAAQADYEEILKRLPGNKDAIAGVADCKLQIACGNNEDDDESNADSSRNRLSTASSSSMKSDKIALQTLRARRGTSEDQKKQLLAQALKPCTTPAAHADTRAELLEQALANAKQHSDRNQGESANGVFIRKPQPQRSVSTPVIDISVLNGVPCPPMIM